jgi:hypothetical protein
MNKVDAASTLPAPTPWPNANARLLGLGVGLPVDPLDRLANFSDLEFERFILEWANGYLSKKLPGVYEVQWRGGAGDKGRDIIVWLDPPTASPRRCLLYQCKHYDGHLGTDAAAVEIGKILYYTSEGDYPVPKEYWFVTHKGVTNNLQDLLDDSAKLKDFIIKNWDKYCGKTITAKKPIPLTEKLRSHIAGFDFSVFRAKQPHDLINEHSHTSYHLTVFGAPLINRPPPPAPPSEVAASENGYISQLFSVIAERLGVSVSRFADFSENAEMSRLFTRSRLTFYSAEGLKELARDQMSDADYFDTFLRNFADGLYHTYTMDWPSGLRRLQATVRAAQSLHLGGHILSPHATPNDREGVCHHLANNGDVVWCRS